MTLQQTIIFTHRWLGVVLCLFFLLWFPSGIGMMYWDFPGVTAADRLDRSPALDAAAIRLSPAEALAALGAAPPPDDVRLDTFDGRPVYRFGAGRAERIVYAETGERQVAVSAEMALRVASAWVKQPPGAAAVDTLEDADQWTVQGSFRALRPLRKYSWPNGEQVYVSQVTGDVVQYTTRASRLGAYLGAIPHWLYFTPLRKHQAQWSTLVTWSSGAGAVSAVLGLIIGVWMYSPSRKYRYAGAASRIPYKGQKRWHMILGLIVGLGAVTWAFSSMLSMAPFPLTGPASDAAVKIPQALRGRIDLAAFAGQPPRDVLARRADLRIKELELASFYGSPAYVAHLSGDRTRIILRDGNVRDEFDRDRIVAIATEAAAPAGLSDIRMVDHYDRYYLDRHQQRPLPVILAVLNDAGQTRLYINPKVARVAGSYSAGSWMDRWLYHGLHSLDFPWLYNHRPAWDIVMIAFMLGGTALSVTSFVLAWRVLGRLFTA